MTAIVPVPAEFTERRDAVLGPVAGQSPLTRIVESLHAVVPVVVAVAADLAGPVRDALNAGPGLRVVTAVGDGDRAACLSAGLAECPDGAVLVHDLAWPVFETATCLRVIAALETGARVVVPTRAVTDSVKAVDEHGVVTATLDRSLLQSAQYPRGFDTATLAELVGAVDKQSDELVAALRAGRAVTEVDGDDHAARFELPQAVGHLTAVIEAWHADR
ncbi:2-C-methyl-D-erythritol 4-phosphate cytidylyltransferase [Mycolicibacterium vaccae]|uniref:2-C-methyl-D-erythritol 4-phosphate cytidylyltransferase n=1 Tax=Mycolicibacterium vaccae TaxID=1810 RepID=UPI003CFC88D3